MTPRGPVVLGAQMTQVQEHSERGIPRYVAEHVRALGQVAPELIARIDLDPARRLPGSLGSWQTSVPIAHQTHQDGREHARLYHVMSPFDYLPIDRLWPRWAHAPGVKLVVTLYDLIPLLFPEYYLQDPTFRQAYFARLDLIRAADAVLAISEATAADAVDHLAIDRSKIHVIHAGCSPFFSPTTRPASALLADLRQTWPSIRDDFIFCAGGIDPRKNLEGLIAAYAGLPAPIRRNRQLVITCRTLPADEARLRALAATFAVDDQLVLTGHVSDPVLRMLYQACGLFVFPSFYEGFGLPVVEAMRCGAPVIASNASSLPALVTDPEARFNPASAADMRNVMLRVWSDRRFLARLRAHSAAARDAYTWEDVAERSAEVYRHVLARSARPARTIPRRDRWAIFSPMPPQATGVADYTSRLAAGLAETCDVDVFVDGAVTDFTVPEHPRVRLIAKREFPPLREVTRYDRLLHCLGNSEFHQHAWQALMQYGGDVLLHEVQLTNLYTALQASGAVPEGTFAATLLRQYGDRLPEDVRLVLPTVRGLPALAAAQYGVFMAADVLRRADRVLLHSEAARHLALLEAPDVADRLHVVPFLAPPIDPARPDDGRIVITTFGIVAETKGASLLVATFAQLADLLPDDAKFVFAGQIFQETVNTLRPLTDSLGITHRIEFTGRLSDADYRDRLRETTVAVQLRTHGHGEMSAALADCLAAGLPTIVSELGGMAELPSDTVVAVPAAIDERALAWTIADLVADRERRAALRARALEYATDRSAVRVARAIQDVVRRVDQDVTNPPASTGQEAVAAVRPSARPRPRVFTARTAAPVAAEEPAPVQPVAHRVIVPGGLGFVICVDPRAFDPISLGCASGTVADPLVDLMLTSVKPGDRVLDIGAHIGSFSLAAAAAGCQVVAFEASPENAALLRESARLNGFANLQVIEVAASDEPGFLSFWSLGPWGHVATGDMPSHNRVRAVRVDDVLAEMGWTHVNFVKLDVEGHEFAVLRGMSALLSSDDAPPILYEANAHTLARLDRLPQELIGAIEDLGYHSFAADDHRLVPVSAHDLQPTLMADYLATKRPMAIARRWPVVAPCTRDELIEMAALECRHESEENRRYIARALALAEPAVRQHPIIVAALSQLATDQVSSVRAAAGSRRASA